MRFRTEIAIEPSRFRFTHKDRILLMGSCFAENIGNKLSSSGFRVDINPFGVLYNPLSVASGLEDLIRNRKYAANDIFEYKGLYSSFGHHSRFSALTEEACLSNINERMLFSSDFLKKISVLMVTFGTAYVYRLKETEQVVSNCHKLPADRFVHRRLCVNEVVEAWKPLISRLIQINPELKILFTVSPIRHWKDGAHENQLSKSVLLLAIEELCNIAKEKDAKAVTGYFPSYELLLDDLRDYRYYAEDMLHPSDIAIDYIWEKFSGCYFDQSTWLAVEEYNSIHRDLEHRPYYPESDAYKAFLENANKRRGDFESRHW